MQRAGDQGHPAGLCTYCGACTGMCPYLVSYKGRIVRDAVLSQRGAAVPSAPVFPSTSTTFTERSGTSYRWMVWKCPGSPYSPFFRQGNPIERPVRRRGYRPHLFCPERRAHRFSGPDPLRARWITRRRRPRQEKKHSFAPAHTTRPRRR